MDYINWESLADNISAWKQELSSSLKEGELVLKETSEEKRRKRKFKSPRRQMCIRLMTRMFLPATATATAEDAHLSTRWVLPP